MVKKLKVKNISVEIKKINNEDFISLTDIAKHKEQERPEIIIQNWMRNKHTIELLGVWEKINNNLKFKHIEFDVFKNQAGSNGFILPPSRWIEKVNAIGIVVKRGKYGGTFAHKHIALAFASWISPEFELYLVSEFDRIKEQENKLLDWNVKRTLTKINYKIHTDSIKENLIPPKISSNQIKQIYSSEADVLNIALFGKTAKDWKKINKNKEGNIRDYSNVSQLVCLSNLENLNSVFIKEKIEQSKRLVKLNQIAISQMKVLTQNNKVKKLGGKI